MTRLRKRELRTWSRLAGTVLLAGLGGCYSTGSERIIRVAEFPDTKPFSRQVGGATTFVDAGYLYKRVTVVGLPLWTYGGRWCGYIGADSSYLDMPKAELDSMAAQAGVQLPARPSLPFADRVLSKIFLAVFVALILLGLFGARRSARSPPDTSAGASQPTDQ